MTLSQIHLTPAEIEAIKQSFQFCFGPDDHLWIFGSRVNPNARGGDIDLYVESTSQDVDRIFDMRLRFVVTLKMGLDPAKSASRGVKIKGIGDRKIDVVVNFGRDQLPIYQVARKEGIQLI